MLKLAFRQTKAEVIVRAAATLIFKLLVEKGCPLMPLSQLAQSPQYGFTASASIEEIGPKLVRITDIQNGLIDWKSVPYCKCDGPEKYLISPGDILFARTGATTGKTYLVNKAPHAVFASYLIRVRPNKNVSSEYLYSFFQSDSYWRQISDEKEGSAQPNVNGQKLIAIQVPIVDSEIQSSISCFLKAVRSRQSGIAEKLPILVPPLNDLRSVVMQIEGMSSKIEEARELRRQLELDYENLCRSIIFDETFGSLTPTPMSELVLLKKSDVLVNKDEVYDFAGVYSFGRGVFKGQRKLGMEFAYSRLTRLKTGNFVYPKLMAWEGAFGVVPPECNNLVVSPEFPVFEIDESRVLPETLDVYFRTPSVWPFLSGTSTGTNVRRRRLHPSKFLSYEIPLPSMETQKRLRKVKVEVDKLKPLHSEISAELELLIPAIIGKALKRV